MQSRLSHLKELIGDFEGKANDVGVDELLASVGVEKNDSEELNKDNQSALKAHELTSNVITEPVLAVNIRKEFEQIKEECEEDFYIDLDNEKAALNKNEMMDQKK